MPGARTSQGIEIADREKRFDRLTKMDELIADLDCLCTKILIDRQEVAYSIDVRGSAKAAVTPTKTMAGSNTKCPDSVHWPFAYGATLLRMIDHSCVVSGSSGYTRL